MYIRWFDTLSRKKVALVGGKNASLGEMHRALKDKGIRVPDGFATTAKAYFDFLKHNGLREKIKQLLIQYHHSHLSLQEVGAQIRRLITTAEFSSQLSKEIVSAYAQLSKRYKKRDVDVAVRSSATAEDLPDASFAGQQDSYLNVRGNKELLLACRRCFASLFTDRAIRYREVKGFDHLSIALSIGIQKMVRADKGGSGVLFTIDTETGFPEVVRITAAFGLGENVVQGTIEPDEYVVFKPLLHRRGIVPILEKKKGLKEKKMVYGGKKGGTKNLSTPLKEREAFVLSDSEILQLTRWAVLIEGHYKMAMDIEWAKDGESKLLFIVQARPETVQSHKKSRVFKAYTLTEKKKPLLEGLAIGEAIVAAKVSVVKHLDERHLFQEGSILVTEMTSPDWVPLMEKASGIITDHGGRTSHAAIVSRELGVPAIVGTTLATKKLKTGEEITLSCAEGDIGHIYEGFLKFEEKSIDLAKVPQIKTQIMMNISSPIEAFRWWQLPCKGIGLARMEFIIDNIIKIHPMALIATERVKDKKVVRQIEELTKGYAKKGEYFVDHLAQGIARIAAVFYPYPVIVRMSDFKTNEYANLIGGADFEPKEENPMLGFRGASRYYSPRYQPGFSLECQAIKRAREKIGLDNIVMMIPFCRTLEEADKVLKVLSENGLKRGRKGLQIYMMCEIPSNVILADAFASRFDGFSIGSNDLTQLVLGVDRDAQDLASLFDERNAAVKEMIRTVIQRAKKRKCKVGICGQAPSDYPGFAEFLVASGIDSISLNPDSVVGVAKRLAKFEKKNRLLA